MILCCFLFCFSIVVDPTKLNHGLHFHEVYGIDCKASWRGPVFRIPITIIKPLAPVGQPPLISISDVSFSPGTILNNCLKSLLMTSFLCFSIINDESHAIILELTFNSSGLLKFKGYGVFSFLYKSNWRRNSIKRMSS